MILWGVLNVTPDSFSDGGDYLDASRAIAHGLQMVDDGADVVDVGGESTRPGAEPVSEQEEVRRVVPVVAALAKAGVRVSIDTSKPKVARAALEEGAEFVNDVTALRDPQMGPLCAGAGCGVCLMHMRGEPRTMQDAPVYADVVGEVREFLVCRARSAEELGISRDSIWIDPGIGFGKTLEQNLEILRAIPDFVATGYPVLVGVSRKSFIGRILDGAPASDRLEGALAAQVLAQASGARAIRTHDVLAARRSMLVAAAILGR